MSLDEHNKLINQIRQHHPASRPKKYTHYGYYFGGLNDYGDWIYEVMVNDSIENLQDCLNQLMESSKPTPAEQPKIKIEDEKEELENNCHTDN